MLGTVEEDISNDSPILTSSFATISRLSAAMCNSFSLFFADFDAIPLRVRGGGIGGVLISSFSFPVSASMLLSGVSDFEAKLNDAEFKLGDSGGVLKSSNPELFDLIVSDFNLRFAQSIGGTLGFFFLAATNKMKIMY